MKKIVVISTFLFASFSSPEKNRYDKIFPDEFKSTISFLNKNKVLFRSVALKHQQNPELLTAIVSPEVMRYSVISDIIETTALELLYCDFGTKAADFSIGKFQIKPSFAESIEFEIHKSHGLNKEYNKICFPKNLSESEQRKLRLKRLKNTLWEIEYLSAFVAICNKKFEDVKFKSTEEKLIFYSTAYNSGFYYTPEKIIQKSKLKFYPYGIKYSGTQYPYSDVALFFYNLEK